MRKIKNFPGWLTVLILCILSVFIYFGVAGCSFLGLLVFGIAGIIASYLLLGILKRHHKKAGKIMIWLLTVLLCLGMLAAVFTGILVGNAARGTEDADCEYLIVLGAGVNGTVPSLSLQDRLNAACDYLKANPKTVCIVSGGQGPGEDITEAQCMANALTIMGIDPDRIWMEDSSTSTHENIAFSLALIQERTGSRPDTAGILSSEYHLYRAGMVAKGQGLTPIGVPAKTSWPHLYLNYFLREIFVVWYYTLFK